MRGLRIEIVLLFELIQLILMGTFNLRELEVHLVQVLLLGGTDGTVLCFWANASASHLS
jgi:hypothetical protein